MTSRGARSMQRGGRTLAGVGAILLGALLGMLALTALSWFRSDLGGTLALGSKVGDLRALITVVEHAPAGASDYATAGISGVYFRWLALLLLLVAVVTAVLGTGTVGRASRAAAAVAAVASLAGLVATALAVQVVHFDLSAAPVADLDPPSYGDFLRATGPGAWAMALAFVLLGVGAVLAAGGRDGLRELLGAADDADDAGDDGDDARAEVPSPEPTPAVSEPAPPQRREPVEDW